MEGQEEEEGEANLREEMDGYHLSTSTSFILDCFSKYFIFVFVFEYSFY